MVRATASSACRAAGREAEERERARQIHGLRAPGALVGEELCRLRDPTVSGSRQKKNPRTKR